MKREIKARLEEAMAASAIAAPVNQTSRTPRILRPARPAHVRRTWAGELKGDTLTVTAGAHVTEIGKEGDELRRFFDARKPCPLELGDKAVVSERQTLALCAIQVLRIVSSTWSRCVYEVRTLIGSVYGSAWVLPATGLRK